MERFEDKIVPLVPNLEEELREGTMQEDICDRAMCSTEDFDCGECLFSSLFCGRATFEQWKRKKLESFEDGQQS